MLKRKNYLKIIDRVIDTPEVKILTGVRRCGKTYLLRQIIDELRKRDIPDENIIYISFESIEYRHVHNDEKLDEIILDKTGNLKGKIYLLFDEIQLVDNWETSVNSYRVDLNCDIFITGSYSKIIAGKNANLLFGRYITINIYPFSFKEYADYKQQLMDTKSPDKMELFQEYLTYGGFPGLFNYSDMDKIKYLEDIYSSILLNEIVLRHNIKNMSIFEHLMNFIISNIGKTFSANSISKYLKNKQLKIYPQTIINYISYAVKAFILYETKREDLIGKELLNVSEKYYVVDPGFYYLVADSDKRDNGFLLENIVYIELLRRGYQVTIGKLNKLEVDFVCKKPDKRIYIQVSESIIDEKTREREFKSLIKIKDSYPKYILTMDYINYSHNGIIHMNIIDFLMMDLD